MIQRESQQTTRLPTRPPLELQVPYVPARWSVRSRANGGSPETPLDRTLARAVRQRSGTGVYRCLLDPLEANLGSPQLLRTPRAPLLQRLAVTVQNRTELAQIKARYLAANPDDHLGWDAVLKAAPSIEALRAQWPAPVVLPTVPQQRAPIVDERPGRAAALTTTDRGHTIGPFGNLGRQIAPAKGPCYYNDDGDYCISPDRDEHAGADTWKLFKRTATSGRGQGWARVDTLHADGRRMNRG